MVSFSNAAVMMALGAMPLAWGARETGNTRGSVTSVIEREITNETPLAIEQTEFPQAFDAIMTQSTEMTLATESSTSELPDILAYKPSTNVLDIQLLEKDQILYQKYLQFALTETVIEKTVDSQRVPIREVVHQIDTEAFDIAQKIMEQGGHSVVVSSIKIRIGADQTLKIKKGDEITGLSYGIDENGEHIPITLKAFEDLEYIPSAPIPDNRDDPRTISTIRTRVRGVVDELEFKDLSLQVLYPPKASDYLTCRVGGLPTEAMNLDGCLMSQGNINLQPGSRGSPSANIASTVSYTYDITKDTYSAVTPGAIDTTIVIWDPTYNPDSAMQDYINSYGTWEFSLAPMNSLLEQAGLTPTQEMTYTDEDAKTSFAVNFPELNDVSWLNQFTDGNVNAKAILAAAAKGSIYMHSFFRVLCAMEYAIYTCHSTSSAVMPGNIWDMAVAYYVGLSATLDGQEKFEEGRTYALYPTTETIGREFGTWREQEEPSESALRPEDQIMGQDTPNETPLALEPGSNLNTKMMEMFTEAQEILKSIADVSEEARDQTCWDADLVRQDIVKGLILPVVQETLRTSYDFRGVRGYDKETVRGERMIYYATIYPFVDKCSHDDAVILKQQLIEAEAPDYAEVEQAFRRNYECMGIPCESVGGIVKTTLKAETNVEYVVGAEPKCEASNINI